MTPTTSSTNATGLFSLALGAGGFLIAAACNKRTDPTASRGRWEGAGNG